MKDSQYAVEALRALRNDALLLGTANEYLCEEAFLLKLGKDIAKNVQRLKDDIVSLKKKYPGKFAREVETDGILEKIDHRAQIMVNPNQEARESCSSGDLGRGLESDVKSIEEAVSLIRLQVYGTASTYPRKDSLLNVFDRVESAGRSLGKMIFLGIKIFLCILVIALLIFLYLFFTMEKEADYRKKIEESQAQIKDQQGLISRLDLEKSRVSEKIKSIEKDEMVRSEKIAILDLEMEIHRINQERQKAETQIFANEKKILADRKRIEEIGKIPFLKRLLRQTN